MLAEPGDLIFCHRKGVVSTIIRVSQRSRSRTGAGWSHVAFVESPDTIIEALTHGVIRSPISKYDSIEHEVIHTHLTPGDAAQAVAFARSCVGQRYGWWTILSIAVRYLTPRHLNGTEICSGLAAQALCRGDANFPHDPASMTPSELRDALPPA